MTFSDLFAAVRNSSRRRRPVVTHVWLVTCEDKLQLNLTIFFTCFLKCLHTLQGLTGNSTLTLVGKFNLGGRKKLHFRLVKYLMDLKVSPSIQTILNFASIDCGLNQKVVIGQENCRILIRTLWSFIKIKSRRKLFFKTQTQYICQLCQCISFFLPLSENHCTSRVGLTQNDCGRSSGH